MDKKSTSRGLIRLNQSGYKNSVRLLPCDSKINEKECFEINTNDFPSLTDVLEDKGKHDRNPLDPNRLSFSYSDKLKTIPQETRENVKDENISKNLSKHGYVSANEHMLKRTNEPHKKDTKGHRLYSGNLASGSLDSHSNLEKAKGNFLHKSSDKYKHNFERKSYSEKSVNKKGSCDVTHQRVDKQHDSVEKEGTHFKITRGDHIPSDSDVPKSIKPMESFGASHFPSKDEWVLKTKIEEQNCKKSEQNIHKKMEYSQFKNKIKSSAPNTSHTHVNKKHFHSVTENVKAVDIHNTSINVFHSESQTTNNSCEQNKVSSQNHNLCAKSKQVDTQVPDIKKKKKRKSRVKRQAAMQTGKIFVLTPEAHSKILNQSRILNTQVQNNIITDINDSEEYPELGTTTIPKVNKESSSKTIEINMKKEIPSLPNKDDATLVQIEPGSDISENISPNLEATKATGVKDNEKAQVETINKEKSPAHAKDAITVSLFDMLLSAKSKKKEPEKKTDAVGDDSPTKVLKYSSKISAKKAVSQFVNPLDSSRPAVKRGKEREKPKVKRPSRMRKLILMGRKLRKEELAVKDGNLVEKSNAVECDIHSSDKLSQSKLYALDKDAHFLELCSGGKIDLFTPGGSNEELVCTSLSEQTEIRQRDEERQDNTDLCNTFFPRPEHNESDNFSSNSNIMVPTTENRKTLSPLLLSKDYLNADKYKENALHQRANEISKITFTLKSHVSNRLAAQFSMVATSADYCATEIFKDQKPDECVFEEAKCVLENLLSHVDNENSSLSFVKTNSTPVEKVEGYTSTFLSNSKIVEMNTNSIKSEYYSCSEDIDNKETLQIEEVFYSVSESPIHTNLNFTKKDTTSDNCVTNLNCSVKTGIDNIDIISTSSNFATKAHDADVFYKSENVLSDSLVNKIIPIMESDAKLTGSDIVPNVSISTKLMENNSTNLFSDEEKFEAVKILIHTRKFRQYCNHFISKEIDKVVFTLLDDLARFQDRMHQKDPVKARVRKRLLYGIKEITRHMKLKKLKCVIIATDIEDIKTEGGLNDVIKEIISLAEAYHIPYIFSHRRFNLGKVCRKAVPVSCVGIFNYEGSEKNFKRAFELQLDSKQEYINVTKAILSILTTDQITEIFKLSKGVPERIYEFRSEIIKNNFYSDSEQNENESINNPGISTNIKLNNCSAIGELENSDSKVQPKSVTTFVLSNDVNSSIESKELNKNEVYTIMKKYNLV